jgi:cytochrome c oxidase accessory protein FixG
MSARSSTLGSMKQDGSRLVLHPADVKGKWMTWRRVAFAVLIAFYVLAPFVPVGGHPMIQLDVQHRAFYLFGQTFNSQDFWLVLLLALSFVFGLLFVTAWRGRVWCGWACPQTVFLEGVYRPIERFFDGPRESRIRLDAAPWSLNKLARRVGKYAAFMLVSLAIAHTAAALFVSPKELWLMIVEGPATHLEAFGLTMGFTAILVFNFAWFREQFCVVVCPYGRLQSVLNDKATVTVAYDAGRGDPRGKIVKFPTGPKLGDCIDCTRCVQVCPTGIDIRNGFQMDCLACTQCIDACDDIMDKVNRPRGLIRFASMNELAGQPSTPFRGRLLVYAALTVFSIGALGVSLAVRTPFEANVYRARGGMPFVVDGEVVRNPLQVHVFNKSAAPSKFKLEIRSPVEAQVIIGTPSLELASLSDANVPVSVSIARSRLSTPVDLVLVVTDETNGLTREQTIRFLGR